MTPTQHKRLEALLAVANHPRTDPSEAATALAGARKVAARAGATDDYAYRFAAIQMSIALTEMTTVWAAYTDAIKKLSRP